MSDNDALAGKDQRDSANQAANEHDRVAAIIAALLGVRNDDASLRFDAELNAAVAAGRLDRDTARGLRWWQRASVRSAERYAAALVPGVLALCADADAAAQADLADAAAAWAHTGLKPASIDTEDQASTDLGEVADHVEPLKRAEPGDAAQPTEPTDEVEPASEVHTQTLRLAPVAELAARRLPRATRRSQATQQPTPATDRPESHVAATTRAIRAALQADQRDASRQSTKRDATSVRPSTDLTDVTVTTGKDSGIHANPATSA